MFKQMRTRIMALSFVVALSITALATTALSQQPKPGGTLRIGVEFDLTRTLDARYIRPTSLYPTTLQIYEFLTGYGAKGMGEIAPLLAESWKQVDPVTYLVNLRKGVKFHNGREMTAEDVKTYFDWNLKTPEGWAPLNRRAYIARVVDKVEMVDKYSLRIRLKEPFAPLISTLRAVEQGIVPPEEVKKWGKDFTLHPSGTGPFKFVEQVPGDRVVLERFDGYWGKRPNLDRVIFRTIPDEQTRIIALQRGEIDVARFDLTALPVIRKDPNLKTMINALLRFQITLEFNTRNWPISSYKFRQAVAMGADWNKYFSAASYAGVVARTFLGRSWAANPKAEELVLPFDPEKARRLIKEVEAEAGRAIPTLTYVTPSIYTFAQAGALAKTQFKKMGVEIKIDVSPSYADSIRALKWDMGVAGAVGPGADPYSQLIFFSTVGEGVMADGKNNMAYVNPKIDELLKRAAATEDRAGRAKFYQEVELILLKDLPGISLYSPNAVWAMNKKVQDFALLNDGGIYVATPFNNTWLER